LTAQTLDTSLVEYAGEEGKGKSLESSRHALISGWMQRDLRGHLRRWDFAPLAERRVTLSYEVAGGQSQSIASAASWVGQSYPCAFHVNFRFSSYFLAQTQSSLQPFLAENLRLDCPLLLIKGLRSAPINAKTARP
jgi:hypothetical protein